ncbi:MAG: hypothetical protein ABSE15_01065 [Candidatus Bathyarchaeia archaeon]
MSEIRDALKKLDAASAISGVLKRNELYLKEQNGYVIFRSLRD